MIFMKVAAQAKLFDFDFVGAEEFARSAHRIVHRLVEVVGISDVCANLGREKR
jgi:hypothetical protein